MYDYKNKQKNVAQLNDYMLAKTLSMFEYSGLPESLPAIELERILQTSGYAFVTEVEGELYAFTGGFGGVPDVYGNPTKLIVSNQALNLNKDFDIKVDGVLIMSDSSMIGLNPLFEKHNTLLVENDINMVINGYNSRIQRMISASDDRTRVSAESYLKKIVDGDIGVIGENALFDGVKSHSVTGSVEVTSMIEYHQYIKSSLYNEIGLGQNFNMKRERLVSAEVDQIKESIYPFVYDMMKCRLEAIKKINAKYGTEIEIGFGSVWSVNFKSYVDGNVESTSEVSNVANPTVSTQSGEVVNVEENMVDSPSSDTPEVDESEVVQSTTEDVGDDTDVDEKEEV